MLQYLGPLPRFLLRAYASLLLQDTVARRIASRNSGSSAAANGFLAILNLAGCAWSSDSVNRRSSARFSAAFRLLTRL